MMKQALASAALAAGTLFAASAMAQTQAPPPQPMNEQYQPQSPAMQSGDWQQNSAAERHAERIGDVYTNALNTLYSHGFHGVQHMTLMNGQVQATAISPNGVPRTVLLNPGTNQISLG